MRYKVWEEKFKCALKSLSEDEIEQSVEYYKEIYLNKTSLNVIEDDITKEFGSPKSCAKKIIAEKKACIHDDENPKTHKGKVWKNVLSGLVFFGCGFLAVMVFVPFLIMFTEGLLQLAICFLGGYYCISFGGKTLYIGIGLTLFGIRSMIAVFLFVLGKKFAKKLLCKAKKYRADIKGEKNEKAF